MCNLIIITIQIEFIYKTLKGVLAYFQMTIYANMAMPDSQRYPWNLYLINNMEDILVCKVFKSDNSYIGFPSVEKPAEEKPQIKIISFLKITNINI